MSQYHKNSDIFMILVAILMKLYTLIGIFIKNHLEKFAGAAINIVIKITDQNINSNSDL